MLVPLSYLSWQTSSVRWPRLSVSHTQKVRESVSRWHQRQPSSFSSDLIGCDEKMGLLLQINNTPHPRQLGTFVYSRMGYPSIDIGNRSFPESLNRVCECGFRSGRQRRRARSSGPLVVGDAGDGNIFIEVFF